MNYYCLTDVGLKREKNQDSYCAVNNKNGDFLALVCDGIGGGKAGDVASGEAVKHFLNNFKENEGFTSLAQATEYLKYSIDACNDEIYKLSIKYKEYTGMGTTLTGILITDKGILSINIGDSRVYGFADSKEFRLTTDHTLVNDMIAKGEITYEESLTHPRRHYLIRALGVWDKVEADIHKIQEMDSYLICSDGLYNYIDPDDLKEIMIDSTKSSEDKCNLLLKKALLNGGYDNITIIVVDSK
ncbi:MAG: Stp1/IreP family PP2C-type Ser/Thr phosphatase [Erysipelotrichaceae bacterium]|nr:Stp1/IreP family PP2C-type Ser/Thr phosphatase [Erysipelotrichaceae bacterium]